MEREGVSGVRGNVRRGFGFPVLFLAVLGVVGGLGVGCGDGGDVVEGRISATTTTTHVTDMVESIGGDEVEVTALMGPGVDPHLYLASQGDVSALRDADAIFYSGLFLEGQMEDILVQVAQQTPTVQVTEAIPQSELLDSEDYEGRADPHVWFDPKLWVTGIDPVVEQLCELKPGSCDTFRENGDSYRDEAMAADEYVRQQIDEIPEDQRVLVTSHDAFRYFGRAYDMEVRGLQGLSTEAEAGAGDVSGLADFLVKNEIPAIFPESSVSPRSLQAVRAAAESRDLDLVIGDELYADAMGDPGTEEGTYPGMLRANADAIAAGLER